MNSVFRAVLPQKGAHCGSARAQISRVRACIHACVLVRTHLRVYTFARVHTQRFSAPRQLYRQLRGSFCIHTLPTACARKLNALPEHRASLVTGTRSPSLLSSLLVQLLRRTFQVCTTVCQPRWTCRIARRVRV